MAKVLDKNKAMREWNELGYARLRKEISALRREARDARTTRKAKLAKARKRCAARRKKADAAADTEFRRALAEDRDRQKAATVRRHAKRKARRTEARELCTLERQDIEADAAEAIQLAEQLAKVKRGELREERAMDRLYWRAHGPRRGGRRGGGKSVSAKQRREERRAEQLDEVRHNLEPGELLVFERVKHQLKPKSHMSLSEVFQHYLHEHSNELQEAQAEHAEAKLRELQESEHAAWLDKHGVELDEHNQGDASGPGVAHAAWADDPAFQSPPVEFSDAVPF